MRPVEYDLDMLRSHRCNWDADELLASTSKWVGVHSGSDASWLDPLSLQGIEQNLKLAVDAVKHGPGLFVLKDVPVTRAPDDVLRDLMRLVGRRFGVLSPMDSAGSLIHEVQVRVPTAESVVRGYETNAELALHNDACDFISFLCVRQARKGGERRVVSAVRVLTQLLEASPHLVPPLFFPIRYQAYFAGGSEPGTYALPLLSMSNGEPFFVVKPGYVSQLLSRGIDPFVNGLHREAFFAFTSLSEDPEFSIGWDVECGDLEIYDNFRILHARTAYEGEDRLLLRVWISDPDGPKLPPQFGQAADYRFTYLSRDRRATRKEEEHGLES